MRALGLIMLIYGLVAVAIEVFNLILPMTLMMVWFWIDMQPPPLDWVIRGFLVIGGFLLWVIGKRG